MKITLGFLIGTSLALLAPNAAHARGFGGGFHGGGFEAGGFHAGGAEAGGYHAGGFEAGGFHASGVEAGGYHAGGVEAGGYHTAGYAGYGAGHVGLPTDGAFGHGWTGAAGYGTLGHTTTAWSGSVAAARGTVVRSSFGNYGAFGAGWYGAHPGAWAATGWAAGAAWNAAAWPAVGAWYGWGSAVQPVYYEYGNNVTYQGDEVYYGSAPVATADQYYQQAATLAQSAPQPDPQSTDWMPLGIFSLVQGEQADSSTMFQLATNKSGAIAGNYYSVLTGSTIPVHGSVDKKTQRVAWTVGDNTTTVYDAGITSLTKDEAPVLLHFGKDRTQQWMLVRLKQPQQAAAK
ncbi:MAG: hypothetical protein ACLQNE_02530 [Thermoguttaceae bacterium]